MAKLYIGLGGNCGDRSGYLYQGLRGCAQHGLRLLALSPIYETAPVGGPAQRDFLNAAAIFESGLDPQVILQILQKVENANGRERAVRNGPRTLDLDLLMFGSVCRESELLTLPHPRMHERLFVLKPLADIAGEVVVPRLERTVRKLCEERAALEPPGAVRPWDVHKE